jgi:hypothetical protein
MGFDLLPGQGGKDDDFGIGLERFDFPDCMKAVLVIDLEIGEDEAVQSIFRLLYGFEAGGHGVHFVTFPGKDFLKRPANQLVIICHQNFVHIIIKSFYIFCLKSNIYAKILFLTRAWLTGRNQTNYKDMLLKAEISVLDKWGI